MRNQWKATTQRAVIILTTSQMALLRRIEFELFTPISMRARYMPGYSELLRETPLEKYKDVSNLSKIVRYITPIQII